MFGKMSARLFEHEDQIVQYVTVNLTQRIINLPSSQISKYIKEYESLAWKRITNTSSQNVTVPFANVYRKLMFGWNSTCFIRSCQEIVTSFLLFVLALTLPKVNALLCLEYYLYQRLSCYMVYYTSFSSTLDNSWYTSVKLIQPTWCNTSVHLQVYNCYKHDFFSSRFAAYNFYTSIRKHVFFYIRRKWPRNNSCNV